MSKKALPAKEEALTPTSIEAWRKPHLQELPSGQAMALKRVALIDLVAQGQIPDTLGPLAAEVASLEKGRTLNPDELKDYWEIVNIVVKAAAVEPPVNDNGGESALAVTEIPWVDRVAIYSWGNGSATALRPFRGESTRVFKAA